jgi:thermostable 8-oxoguanine DNA glycosylase
MPMVIENGLNFCLDYLIRAEEVKASMNIKRSLEQMLLRKSHQVNLSTVRSKYRFSRKKARYVHFQI